jgi:hypothetical protein
MTLRRILCVSGFLMTLLPSSAKLYLDVEASGLFLLGGKAVL